MSTFVSQLFKGTAVCLIGIVFNSIGGIVFIESGIVCKNRNETVRSRQSEMLQNRNEHLHAEESKGVFYAKSTRFIQKTSQRKECHQGCSVLESLWAVLLYVYLTYLTSTFT
jgi:hypothetical protein